MSDRAKATQLVTAAVLSWLWKRGCRVLATEVGYDARGLGPPTQREFRADVVGMMSRAGERTIHLIEVKGSQADFNSEDWSQTPVRKWGLTWSSMHMNPWLAIGPGVDMNRAVMAVGLHWGVVVATPEGHIHTVRGPFIVKGYTRDDPHVVSATEAMAASLTATRMPMMMGLTRAQAAAKIADALADEQADG